MVMLILLLFDASSYDVEFMLWATAFDHDLFLIL